MSEMERQTGGKPGGDVMSEVREKWEASEMRITCLALSGSSKNRIVLIGDSLGGLTVLTRYSTFRERLLVGVGDPVVRVTVMLGRIMIQTKHDIIEMLPKNRGPSQLIVKCRFYASISSFALDQRERHLAAVSFIDGTTATYDMSLTPCRAVQRVPNLPSPPAKLFLARDTLVAIGKTDLVAVNYTKAQPVPVLPSPLLFHSKWDAQVRDAIAVLREDEDNLLYVHFQDGSVKVIETFINPPVLVNEAKRGWLFPPLIKMPGLLIIVIGVIVFQAFKMNRKRQDSASSLWGGAGERRESARIRRRKRDTMREMGLSNTLTEQLRQMEQIPEGSE
eukprot:GHVN01086294.1.p1 GENE.GHVN01086294.1~~GHVN01086294.1.p1  ORF type:complete len:334 (+),score=65.08 GHVN01086294.1:245-1246(+)